MRIFDPIFGVCQEGAETGFVTLFGACDLSALQIAIDHGQDKLQRLSLSARDHSAGDLAVSSVSRLSFHNVMMWTAPAPASGSIESCAKMVVVEQPFEGAPSMGKSITDLSSVTTVGLDLAKHVFQVHGVDAFGRVIVAKALRRKDVLGFFAQLPRCLVGLEACGSAHHWARELIKLGHDARMMPPAYVKPYVRRQKNDAADAAGICEAVTRPSMRFVGVRTAPQAWPKLAPA